MVANDRPSQYKQSSRKGKKAWRKNIDLTDIETSIKTSTEHEITHGSSNITELPSAALFQVDVKGDEALKSKLIKRKQIAKTVKSAEILAAIKDASKVPALCHPKSSGKKHAKIQGVSKKEVSRLMALAGRGLGESKSKAQVSKEGLIKSKGFDLWGKDNNEVKLPSGIKLNSANGKIPEPLLEKSSTGWSVATVAPDTIKRAPVNVKEINDMPHAGKSYNPDQEHWEQLIKAEYEVEKVNENRRVQLEEYKRKIKHLMETLDDNEEESDEEDESEPENTVSDDEEVGDNVKLSVNAAVKNKKKTKYQRNKQKRHEEKVKLQQELKRLKVQLHQLEKFEDIEIEATKQVQKQVQTGSKTSRKVSKNPKLGTKHCVKDNQLEVKFSDELSDSLRKLRPEGNLLYDNMRKLQGSGKIETRVPVRKGRKYKKKITEKWRYKDFK
ncbi:Nop53p Ecym_2412 [Eremothecium cymbalariae DBVPG|uniref:Ribosome biogenesis protein NOP53 n=1 Tax=Eremothecium cymbalariae (strain CBS 270.75 / DBVPG 7215 / KCTC 17166 / NRRL Y-17582) TaxID=931890 RepID=G8JP86_ERECY|nr:Hypothetical protein Ecym_2412 [Eremothecium cymbalariae DBVPG\